MKLIKTFCLLFILFGNNFIFGQNYTEILGRPTDESITVSILFDQKVDLYIEYGTTLGVYTNTTSTITNVINIPDEIDLQNLNPNTKYYYRTRYRLTGSGSFLSSAEHTFHTQRATGSTFVFTIESDEHLYDKKGVRNMYQVTLTNQANDNPDFMLDLGDIFGDDHNPTTITSNEMDALHKDYRQYLGKICHSVPFYICLGNHEGEKDYYLHQSPPNNMAVFGTLWRKFYYPNPFPNNFYTGDTVHEPYGMGQPENYYAWIWGDALFVVLDVYRYDCDTSAKPKNWNWTLGQAQYDWLKSTLETSTSKYKFVFAHHVSGEGRGGIVQGKLFEWGGYEQDGKTYTFTKNRPNMAKPIHKLFVDNGVNIYFQGHDHLFAHEVMDGVTYQEVPMPSDSTYRIGVLANADAYVSDTIDGTGHIRVTVSPSCVKVDYIRAYLPADTVSGIHHNRENAFSYTIGNCQPNGINNIIENTFVKIYPNPAKNIVQVSTETSEKYDRKIEMINTLGEKILFSEIKSGNLSSQLNITDVPSGVYFITVYDGVKSKVCKVVINN